MAPYYVRHDLDMDLVWSDQVYYSAKTQTVAGVKMTHVDAAASTGRRYVTVTSGVDGLTPEGSELRDINNCQFKRDVFQLYAPQTKIFDR